MKSSKRRLFWDGKLDSVGLIDDIKTLPKYSHQFFFKYIEVFKLSFVVLTTIAVLNALAQFASTYLLSDLLSNVSTISTERLLKYYLVLYVIAKLFSEGFSFVIRKYSEAFPQTYTDYITISFYKTIIHSNFHRLLGFSNEKLNQLVTKYIGGINSFLSQWVWGIPFHITNLVIVIAILAFQSPLILLINAIYFTFFIWYAFSISSKFGEIT